MVDQADIDRAVEEIEGKVRLRPGQGEAIRAAVERDTLAVLATGTGKTLIYRVAGRLRGGLTVVISPTVSLQMDQLAALDLAGPPAEALHSLLPKSKRQDVLDAVAEGALGFLLLSPEQVTRDDVREALHRADVRLCTVDEAQCVSAWGHDFRPDYLGLPAAIDALGRPPILALTATASQQLRRDICAALGMRDPAVVVGEVDRPNIWLGARVVADEAAADEITQEALAAQLDEDEPGTSIVYVASRRRSERLANALGAGGITADHYHGSLSRSRREEVLSRFQDGSLPVVVATSAFGLGIDKPDVRLVLHADPPGDLDSLYQEVGRAGRDGRRSRGLLLSRPAGYTLPHFFASGSDARRDDVAALLGALSDSPRRPGALRERTGLSAQRLRRATNALLAIGAVAEDRRGLRRTRASHAATELVDEAMHASEQRRVRTETGVELVRRYADTTDCRRRLVLQLLGENVNQPCGRCDNCEAGTSQPADQGPYFIGQEVDHPEWGHGMVQQLEDDRVTVLFEDGGFRTLARDVVESRDLLDPAS